MDNRERVRRAEVAQQLLNNDVLTEAFASLEKASIAHIRRSDPDEILKAADRLKAIDALKTELQRIVDAGVIAAKQDEAADRTDRDRKATGFAPGDVP